MNEPLSSSTDAGARVAHPPVEAGTACYIYAVARPRDGHRPEASPSVDLGRPPAYGLPHRDLMAIVRPVPLAEFGPEALEANLEDLAWVRDKVLGHQQFMACLLDRYTLIPFKFAALFSSEDSVREMMDQHYERFEETLARLEGAAEWGVKIFCSRQDLLKRLRETWDGLETLRRAISRAPEGAAYFLRKKLEQAAELEAQHVIDACLRESHAPRRLGQAGGGQPPPAAGSAPAGDGDDPQRSLPG